MKKLIASLIHASLISSASALAQTEEHEIRLLIARAPVAKAMAKAEEMEFLIVFDWLTALAYTGHTKEAFAAAAKIKEAAKIGELMDEAEAEYETNSAIAMGLAIAGKVDDALSLLRRTKNRSSQSIIIEILATDGRFSEALNETRKAENASDKDYNLKLIARELAASGEIKQALEIASEIKDKNILNDTLRVVLKLLLKAGKLTEAKFIAESIQPNPTEDFSLRSEIFDLVFDMANDGAQENALAMVNLIENEADRSWPLSVIAESFIEAGRLHEALETARKIKDESLLPITLAKVAAGFAGKDENNAARNLLNEAVEAVSRITDEKKREEVLSSLNPEPAGSGLVAKPPALANSLDNKAAFERGGGIKADGRTKVEGLLKAGKIDDALTVAQNIEDEDDRSEAFVIVAEFLLHSGSYRRARLTADRCPSPVHRMFLYFQIFNVLSFRRNPQLRKKIKNSRLIN